MPLSQIARWIAVAALSAGPALAADNPLQPSPAWDEMRLAVIGTETEPPVDPAVLDRLHVRIAAAAAACALALSACSGDGGETAAPNDTATSAGGDQAELIKDGEIVIAMSGEFKPFSHF